MADLQDARKDGVAAALGRALQRVAARAAAQRRVGARRQQFLRRLQPPHTIASFALPTDVPNSSAAAFVSWMCPRLNPLKQRAPRRGAGSFASQCPGLTAVWAARGGEGTPPGGPWRAARCSAVQPPAPEGVSTT